MYCSSFDMHFFKVLSRASLKVPSRDLLSASRAVIASRIIELSKELPIATILWLKASRYFGPSRFLPFIRLRRQQTVRTFVMPTHAKAAPLQQVGLGQFLGTATKGKAKSGSKDKKDGESASKIRFQC